VIALAQPVHRDWWRRETPSGTAPRPAAGRVPALEESKSSLWAYRALLAFVVVNLVSPQSFIPALAPLRLAFMSALGAAGAYMVAMWSAPEAVKTPTSTAARCIWVLVAWALLTIPASIWPGGSVALFLNQYSKTIILFWLVSSVLTSTKKLRSFYWTLAFCCIPLAYTAVKNAASGITAGDGERIAGYTSGIAANPNDLALTLNILIPLIASLAFTARNRTERLGALAIIAISAAAVGVTFSRCGFIVLTFNTMLFAGVLAKRGKWGIVGTGAVMLLLALPALPSSYLERLSTIVGVQNDTTGSAQERLELMSVATQVVQAHPLLGVGLGNDALAINAIKSLHWRRVHNAYLNYAVDLGIPGALLFVAALLATIGTAWRIERSAPGDDPVERDLPTLAQGVRVSLMGFAVAANFAPVPYDFYFYYLAGLSVAVWKCRTLRVAPAKARG